MEIIDPWIAEISVIIAIPLVAYIANWFRVRTKKVRLNTEDIDKIREDVKQIKRLLVMQAKRLDKGSAKYHNDDDSAYEELVKDLLTTEILRSRGSCPI
jgi:hypothetical protein